MWRISQMASTVDKMSEIINGGKLSPEDLDKLFKDIENQKRREVTGNFVFTARKMAEIAESGQEPDKELTELFLGEYQNIYNKPICPIASPGPRRPTTTVVRRNVRKLNMNLLKEKLVVNLQQRGGSGLRREIRLDFEPEYTVENLDNARQQLVGTGVFRPVRVIGLWELT